MSHRNNRPAPNLNGVVPSVSTTTPPPSSTRQPQLKNGPTKSRRILWIVVVVAAVLLLALAAWVFIGRSGATAAINSSEYQAVFFTDGKVYFGKLGQLNSEYMTLKDVYYLQSKATSTDKSSPQSASSQSASDVELIKLGNEIHGPEDQMVISKDQILFFENLKPDGKVSKSIATAQKKS